MTVVKYGRVQVEYYHFLPSSTKKIFSTDLMHALTWQMIPCLKFTHTHFQQINICALDDKRYKGMLYLPLCRSVGIWGWREIHWYLFPINLISLFKSLWKASLRSPCGHRFPFSNPWVGPVGTSQSLSPQASAGTCLNKLQGMCGPSQSLQPPNWLALFQEHPIDPETLVTVFSGRAGSSFRISSVSRRIQVWLHRGDQGRMLCLHWTAWAGVCPLVAALVLHKMTVSTGHRNSAGHLCHRARGHVGCPWESGVCPGIGVSHVRSSQQAAWSWSYRVLGIDSYQWMSLFWQQPTSGLHRGWYS